MTDEALPPVVALGLQVYSTIVEAGASAAVIGAWAMVAHGHIRQTDDLDLGVFMPLQELRALAERLRSSGLVVDLHEPDPVDPLGGVIDVEGPDELLVQVVHFFNSTQADDTPMRRAGAAALTDAGEELEGTSLRVVGLGHLVTLKLLAWDVGAARSKSADDVLALLKANPGQFAEVAGTCERLAGPEWRVWLARFGSQLPGS